MTLMNNILDYKYLKEVAQNSYNNYGSVFSPVLKDKINFSAGGFNHIVYKNSKSEREKPSQILRFRLLPLAKKLIEISTTYQEFEELIKEVVVKKHKKKVKENRKVRYWALIAIINSQKIKVILKKVGDNGSLHFWSIIPNWKTSKFRDIKLYTTMKGNPEED